MNYAQRIERLRNQLTKMSYESYALISIEGSDAANLRYLTGFSGSYGVLLVTQEQAVFLTDSRYFERAKDQLNGVEVQVIKRIEDLNDVIKQLHVRQIALNPQNITVFLFNELKEKIDGVDLVADKNLVAELRQSKDADEIERIEQAQRLTDKTFAYIIDRLKPGMTEKEAAWEMEVFMKQNGSDGLAFSIMVASGPNAASPHHETSGRQLQANEFVLFDFGAKWDGYCADLTRTVCLGTPDAKQKEIYQLVLDAQQASLDAIRADVEGQDADQAGRTVISDGGYGEHFGHGTGHGVGLEVHEGPVMSPLRKSTLPQNAVVTIEPGIYLSGWGGVRIEDIAVVTQEGVRNLTTAPKELLSI